MDGASVISLSSTSRSSHQGDNSLSLASVVSVSSESERIPVSWDSNGNGDNGNILENENSPNPTEKVKDWMYSCSSGDENGYSSPELCKADENTGANKSMCIRYDFDKSTRASSLPKSCYTRTTPLFSYMEEAKKKSFIDNVRFKRAKSIDAEQFNGNNIHRNNKANYDTPLSPETQKKELCSYLQLMKPGDQPENFFIEHRRSVRVKNLNQMNEKKKLEERLKDKDPQTIFSDFEEYEKVVEDVINYPTLKSFEELNMKMDRFERYFNLKRKNKSVELNKYLPLPPKRIYEETIDFEECIRDTLEEIKKCKRNHVNGCLRKAQKRRKFNFSQFRFKRIKSLRSKGYLRNISLDTLILRKSHTRKKAAKRRQLREFRKKMAEKNENADMNKIASPRCEIISIHTNSDDENVDLKNFVDDMLELDKMSEEHRKSVIESRILASSSITNLINKQTTQEEDVQRAYKIFSDFSNEKKNSEEKENSTQECIEQTPVADLIISEHDYADFNQTNHQEEEDEDDESVEEDCLDPVPIPDLQVLPVNQDVETKSLHRSLTLTNKRKLYSNNYGLHNWSSGAKSDSKKLNHSISISKKNGAVLRAFYQDYNLVITQQNAVSFWTQSALGNVLGAQNMWIPKGQSQRIPMNSTYTEKDAMEMVISTETSVAYVELWTKEHKSDIREVPVADVFAMVYFWRLRQNGLDKKALQLENIKGFADDVQYVVLRCYPRIIVSWYSVQGGEKKTKIHSYHLAADYQTVASINEIQPIEHHVASLHNIEDCDNLIMGCGENKMTLWNIEYGYIVATIELSNIKSPLSTQWLKCDRGFLFIIQECVDQELRLIAINGMNHSWKKLQNYNPPSGFNELKGVCIENGVLVSYYSQGILCWNAQTGELIVEEVPNECEYIPSGKHVIMIVNEKIIVRHSLSHLITADDF